MQDQAEAWSGAASRRNKKREELRRLLQHLVDGMRPVEPSTFGIMIPVVVVAALLASLVPARRASRVDPMSALRQE